MAVLQNFACLANLLLFLYLSPLIFLCVYLSTSSPCISNTTLPSVYSSPFLPLSIDSASYPLLFILPPLPLYLSFSLLSCVQVYLYPSVHTFPNVYLSSSPPGIPSSPFQSILPNFCFAFCILFPFLFVWEIYILASKQNSKTKTKIRQIRHKFLIFISS
jgi:hypothetical protein